MSNPKRITNKEIMDKLAYYDKTLDSIKNKEKTESQIGAFLVLLGVIVLTMNTIILYNLRAKEDRVDNIIKTLIKSGVVQYKKVSVNEIEVNPEFRKE